MAVFIFFKPNDKDLKELDLPVPDRYYDNVSRPADEMIEHLKQAFSAATEGWTLDQLRARLVFMKLSGYPEDEIQVVYLTQYLKDLEAKGSSNGISLDQTY